MRDPRRRAAPRGEAWHARVLVDEVVSHAFGRGYHPQHSERLAVYWAEALGGPPTFFRCLRRRDVSLRIHSGNGPHDEMNQRAITCFDLRDGHGMGCKPDLS